VQFLVQHDILTELPNRTEFRDRLKGAIARAQRNARQVAVMLINIDRFKAINTKHGAETGDMVLCEVALRLKSSIRQADSVARVAGDEFGLILEAIDQREQAAVVANRVLANLKAPLDAGGVTFEITGSAGIAAFPSDAGDLDTVLRMADVAMYAAKEGGADLPLLLSRTRGHDAPRRCAGSRSRGDGHADRARARGHGRAGRGQLEQGDRLPARRQSAHHRTIAPR
jgi:diguanylate cyclase (GGDEF)-like protein